MPGVLMPNIGRYELLDKLGQGGMGVVYRARDTLLERIVAVKVISAPIEENAELRERFFREARAAGQLSHKNIITIHDLGEHDGQPYLAMEYLEGQDLLARMRSPQRMSLRRRVEIATEICEGLEFAHTHGVVHRDIKPANIFLTDPGQVKILDFGLARLVTSELTRSNMMMGTINYMAPEQIRGERTDHRADIFSTAVVLYELFSGRRAFEAESFAATLYKILQELPEPLQQIDPALPTDLVQIVDRGLAKPRDERYQHMSEMLFDLAIYRQQIAGTDSPASGRTAPAELRTPSDRPFAVTPGSPLPPMANPPTPVTTPAPFPSAPASGFQPAGRLRAWAMPAIAVLALGVAGAAMWKASGGPAPS
ncbi:MAG: serine/threonine protein kinase, partial [Acidobacteriota bacterium]|nr:serine/threonine protein kinase [Acidobacteriota bacterium]